MSAVLQRRIVEVAASVAVGVDPGAARDGRCDPATGTQADATHGAARVEARRWLLTALTRTLRGLVDPSLAALVGAPVPGATLPLGARIPGTSLELDPASAAANLGLLLHRVPADPATLLAPLLAAGDYAARRAHYDGVAVPTVATLLDVLARSVAIQAGLAADPLVAADPWLAPRVAGAFGATALLGGDAARCQAAAQAAALDGSPPSPAALQGLHDGAAAIEIAQRRAAGENAARALRQALVAAALAAPPAARPAAAAAIAASGIDEASLTAAFAAAVQDLFPARQAAAIRAFFADPAALDALGLDACLARLVRN